MRKYSQVMIQSLVQMNEDEPVTHEWRKKHFYLLSTERRKGVVLRAEDISYLQSKLDFHLVRCKFKILEDYMSARFLKDLPAYSSFIALYLLHSKGSLMLVRA